MARRSRRRRLVARPAGYIRGLVGLSAGAGGAGRARSPYQRVWATRAVAHDDGQPRVSPARADATSGPPAISTAAERPDRSARRSLAPPLGAFAVTTVAAARRDTEPRTVRPPTPHAPPREDAGHARIVSRNTGQARRAGRDEGSSRRQTAALAPRSALVAATPRSVAAPGTPSRRAAQAPATIHIGTIDIHVAAAVAPTAHAARPAPAVTAARVAPPVRLSRPPAIFGLAQG